MYYVEYEGYLYERKEDRYPQKGKYVVCVVCHVERSRDRFPKSRGDRGYTISPICNCCRIDANGRIKELQEEREEYEMTRNAHQPKIDALKKYIKEQRAEGNYNAIFYGDEYYHRGDRQSYPIPLPIRGESEKTLRLQRGAMQEIHDQWTLHSK
jgi:hypothetical protein